MLLVLYMHRTQYTDKDSRDADMLYVESTVLTAGLSPTAMRVDGKATTDTHTRGRIWQRSFKCQRIICLWQSLKKEGEETTYKYLMPSSQPHNHIMMIHLFYRLVC